MDASWVEASSTGVYREYSQEKKNELFDFFLNYQKDLSEIKSRIDVMAGYEWRNNFV